MARKVDKDAKKREIALSALDIFAKNGLQKSSVDEIAKRAGVAKGTIYLYFGNKEEIALEIWRSLFEGHEAWLDGALKKCKDESSKIVSYIYMGHYDDDFLKKILTLYKDFLASTILEASPHFKEFSIENFNKNIMRIKESLKNGIKSGEFVDVDLDYTAETILYIKNGYLLSAMERGLGPEYLRPKLPSVIEAYLDSIKKEKR